MDLLKILKFNVFLVSFAMFCYQLQTATLQLMNPGLVDINHARNVTDDDMPLITVCPTNQINLTRVKKLGYFSHESLLWGSTKCNETTYCTSWGPHLNLTFEDLKEQVSDLKRLNKIYIKGGKFKNGSVFLPGYGLCKETSFLNNKQEIILGNLNDVRVFITNRNYRSYFMPYVASHVGKEIFIEPKTKHYVNVNIQVKSYCNINDEKPMSKEDFAKCVDDKIQNELEQYNISCSPPWFSYNKQCNQTYPQPKPNAFYNKFNFHKYEDLLTILKNIQFEDECRQSCKESTYIVDEGFKDTLYSKSFYLTLNQKVIVTEKVPNYNMFKYIIDVGSSLGLWLGLSVLGLHDLVVWAVQFVNNSFIIKKIRSAVTK